MKCVSANVEENGMLPNRVFRNTLPKAFPISTTENSKPVEPTLWKTYLVSQCVIPPNDILHRN